MKLKNMPKEELELMSYTDLTYKILKEEKKPLNTPTIFHHICDLLGYSNEEFEDKIGDYYTSLTIDKRFIMLDNGYCDLKINHSSKVIIDDEDEDFDIQPEDQDDINEIEEEDNYDEDANPDDDTDNDLQDLVIIDDLDELDSDMM